MSYICSSRVMITLLLPLYNCYEVDMSTVLIYEELHAYIARVIRRRIIVITSQYATNAFLIYMRLGHQSRCD